MYIYICIYIYVYIYVYVNHIYIYVYIYIYIYIYIYVVTSRVWQRKPKLLYVTRHRGTSFPSWVAESSKALRENLEEGCVPGSNPTTGSWSLFTLAV